ncbi:MAG: hypothetical protein WCG01_05360 [bacterium]
MSKKTIITFSTIMIAIIGLSAVLLRNSKAKFIKNPKKTISTNQENSIITKPLANNTTLKSCANDVACDAGYICYHSQYSGMGPSGPVAGDEEGDLLCHKACSNDNDCKNENCETVEIYGGDIANTTKFCFDKN